MNNLSQSGDTSRSGSLLLPTQSQSLTYLLLESETTRGTQNDYRVMRDNQIDEQNEATTTKRHITIKNGAKSYRVTQKEMQNDHKMK